MAVSDPAPATASREGIAPRRELIEIFVVSFAGLLLEISYTRIISFKLFYYYTYLIIGLALLGIGTGGVAVAVSARLRRAPLSVVIGWASALGALGVFAGYYVVAKVDLNTLDIWAYGEGRSFENLARLLVVCVALFAPFAMVGLMFATWFGRRSEAIGRYYFADLAGAGLACALVVFLIRDLGPPTAVMISGLVLALVALSNAVRTQRWIVTAPAALLVVALLGGTVWSDSIEVDVDASKQPPAPGTVTDSEWSPIFRVDAAPIDTELLLYHDGLLGSRIVRWDGDLASLSHYDSDPRSLPFAVLGDAPDDLMIIGAAGGNEILTSIYYDAGHVDAIELNPITHNLLTDTYADYSGNIAHDPRVDYVLDDGRSFLERSDSRYDLVWYPAPDSYAAANAATSGAFVLSESYLYTADAIEASLEQLTDDGILAAQFGEVDFEAKPNRTGRYLSTVRLALDRLGVDDPSGHVMVATSPTELGASVVSTILVKATPFTEDEVARFSAQSDEVTDGVIQHVPGQGNDGSVVSSVLTLPDDELDAWYDRYEFDIRPITDDAPYFWNFARYGNVIRDLDQRIDSTDPEAGTGERVLLLLLGIAIAFALVFLIVPFLAIRKEWRALPRKGISALYFSCLGLGFLFFEITLIQRLTLFLGYPTYSLTVTLASVLLFTGVGALLSERVVHRGWKVGLWLLGALALLTVFYEVGLPAITNSLFDLGVGARVAVAFVLLAPLGLCLGMFMPLGLRAVGRLSPLSREYVAWGWAVNGFASVVGSVLTTLLSMTFGFRTVMVIALVVYAVAVTALRGIMGAPSSDPDLDVSTSSDDDDDAEAALLAAT